MQNGNRLLEGGLGVGGGLGDDLAHPGGAGGGLAGWRLAGDMEKKDAE